MRYPARKGKHIVLSTNTLLYFRITMSANSTRTKMIPERSTPRQVMSN
uniref:Uncharacterized protein n=1 Tax=Arundo donax TaxID=35708 RepID=A0A0A9DNY8_ARUDO